VTLDQCVRNLMAWTACSIAQAVECVTTHPAKLLGIENEKGSLKPGLDADFVILDDAGNVHQTWKFGSKVFDAAMDVRVNGTSHALEKPSTKTLPSSRVGVMPFGEEFLGPRAGLKIITDVRVH
jgi:adenine deaminase